jgi:hypothetical protein
LSSAVGRAEATVSSVLIRSDSNNACKTLILLVLLSWLAALDDFRNSLIREAA